MVMLSVGCAGMATAKCITNERRTCNSLLDVHLAGYLSTRDMIIMVYMQTLR